MKPVSRVVTSASVISLVGALLVLPGVLGVADAAPTRAAKAMKCKGRVATIVGTNGPDVIKGTPARDVIAALDGDDRIQGGDGNDIICGGGGRDFIDGGRGDDKLFGGLDGRSETRNSDGERLVVGDVIEGGKGDDLIDLGYDPRQLAFGSVERDRLSYKGAKFKMTITLGTPRHRGRATGEGNDILEKHPYLTVLGSEQGDRVIGSPWDDQILGRGGRDEIDGGPGRDVLVDGLVSDTSVDDILRGGLGNDELMSYAGHDMLDGGRAGDLITLDRPSAGPVTLLGGPGDDVFTLTDITSAACINLDGGVGADEVVPTVKRSVRIGKLDADLRSGAFGLRKVSGDSCGIVKAVETLTLDNAYSAILRWFVIGTAAAETVMMSNGGSIVATMSGGDDRVVATTGVDTHKGGPGDDRLYGGLGQDTAEGGRGTDTCRQVEVEKSCELPD
jgi:Ca2+-binding RTX toxin-like protein